jgi:hypothetical protein
MLYSSCSLKMGWNGLIDFGFVGNDPEHWKPVGCEFPVHNILSYTEEGFEAACFDEVIRYFKYFKFDQIDIRKLSDYDKNFLYRVYY